MKPEWIDRIKERKHQANMRSWRNAQAEFEHRCFMQSLENARRGPMIKIVTGPDENDKPWWRFW